MSGLLRRIRRPGAAEETRTEATALPEPAHGSAPESPAPSEDGQRLPAGAAPADIERRQVTGRRGKLRRRARFLRRARELALRDLGGLVYEARRRERDPGKLAEEKVQKLIALDAELHGLEDALGSPRGETVLREPGIGGTCARCGELHASDASFCARCGANLAEAAREAAAAEAERRAAAEKAAADKAAAEKAEADKAAAEKAEAEKAEADTTKTGTAAADTAAADKPDGRHSRGRQAGGRQAGGRHGRGRQAGGRHAGPTRRGRQAGGRHGRGRQAGGRHGRGRQAGGRHGRGRQAGGRHGRGRRAGGLQHRRRHARGRQGRLRARPAHRRQRHPRPLEQRPHRLRGADRGRRAYRDPRPQRMTDVATPPPAPQPAAEQRACPRCGAGLEADQEWCLNCGNAVGTRIAPTPRWRLPIVLVGGVLALLVVALVLSLVELGGDPQPVAKAPNPGATATPSAAPDDGAATPAPTTAPQPTPEAGTTPTPTPDAASPDGTAAEPNPIPTPAGSSPTAGGLATWPEGKTAWTVVIASTSSRAEAEKKATAAGADAGVLHSDDYSSLRKGYWVVFAGQYPDQEAAQSAAEGKGGDAYARRVVPR